MGGSPRPLERAALQETGDQDRVAAMWRVLESDAALTRPFALGIRLHLAGAICDLAEDVGRAGGPEQGQ